MYFLLFQEKVDPVVSFRRQKQVKFVMQPQRTENDYRDSKVRWISHYWS